MAKLTAEAAVSNFHFVWLFRSKTENTPDASLKQVRIDATRCMLAAIDLPAG